jgi:large subunit ribosomal protein L21
MYAIIETGGKQYRVEKGDVIDVELLDKQEKDIEFSNVLFINNGSDVKLGNPYLSKSVVKKQNFCKKLRDQKSSLLNIR